MPRRPPHRARPRRLLRQTKGRPAGCPSPAQRPCARARPGCRDAPRRCARTSRRGGGRSRRARDDDGAGDAGDGDDAEDGEEREHGGPFRRRCGSSSDGCAVARVRLPFSRAKPCSTSAQYFNDDVALATWMFAASTCSGNSPSAAASPPSPRPPGARRRPSRSSSRCSSARPACRSPNAAVAASCSRAPAMPSPAARPTSRSRSSGPRRCGTSSATTPSGEVTLLTFPTMGATLLPGVLTDLSPRSPASWCRRTDLDPELAEFADLTSDYDIVLAHTMPGVLPWGGRGLKAVPLLTEPLDIGLPADHRLAGRAHVTPADLVDETWLGVPPGLPVRAHPARDRAGGREPRARSASASATCASWRRSSRPASASRSCPGSRRAPCRRHRAEAASAAWRRRGRSSRSCGRMSRSASPCAPCSTCSWLAPRGSSRPTGIRHADAPISEVRRCPWAAALGR